MKKLYFALVAILLCAISADAAKLYVKEDLGQGVTANYAVWAWETGQGGKTIKMSIVEGEDHLHVAEVGNCTNFIFFRIDPSTFDKINGEEWTENYGATIWNKSGSDVAQESGKDCYYINSWDNGISGYWTTFTPSVVMNNTKLYFKPNSSWADGSAWTAVYFFSDSKSEWVKMTKVEAPGINGDIYEFVSPTTDYKNLIFVRQNPQNTDPNWDWGQTNNLVWDGKANVFEVTSFSTESNKGEGTWSNVEKTATPEISAEGEPFKSDVTISGNGTIEYQIGEGEWTAYTETLNFTESTTISAYAYESGKLNSDVDTYAYVRPQTYFIYVNDKEGWETEELSASYVSDGLSGGTDLIIGDVETGSWTMSQVLGGVAAVAEEAGEETVYTKRFEYVAVEEGTYRLSWSNGETWVTAAEDQTFKANANYFVTLGNETMTGVEDIEIDENAPVEYYNFQGVRVANPEKGMYIRVQGGKATKVIL